MEIITVRNVMAAAQLVRKMSKQMAPLAEEILGCHTFVANLMIGGRNGYSGGMVISSLNVPPSYALPGGPIIKPIRWSSRPSTDSRLTMPFSESLARATSANLKA